MIFSRCTLLFQTDVSERSKKYKEQTMPFSSYLQLSDRLQIVSMLIMISEAGFCFVKEKNILHIFPNVSEFAILKEQLQIVFWWSPVFFLQTLAYWNTSLDILTQHRHIMTLILMFMVMNFFFFFWRGTLSHIWFINVMNARNDQIICSCVLDMQWGALDWLKFKIGMPKLY